MQPFMKNVSVEYAEKAAPGGEIDKSINNKTTIEEVTELIEGGTVKNAKPIYIHPITIQGTKVGPYNVNMRVNFLIFNNSSTPFILSTFKTYLDNLAESTGFRVKILSTGGMNKIKLTSSTTAENDTLIISSIDKAENGSYAIMGYGISTGGITNFADADFNVVFPSGVSFVDGVYKIN